MRRWWIAVVGLALAGACNKQDAAEPSASKPGALEPSTPKPEPTQPQPPIEAAAPVHVAPSGSVQGVAFTPDTVRLEETSDGTILEFTTLKPDRRDRVRCSGTEMSAERELQVYLTDAIVESGKGEQELASFSGTDIPFANPVAGMAKIEISKRDAATFRMEGTIEIASADGTWKFSGPFAGEYCPTKVVPRESAELLGQAWTLAAVDPATLVDAPIDANIAGLPAEIAAVTLRETKDYEGKLLHQLVFYTQPRADPCAERPYGGGGSLASEPNDSFAIDLALAPTKGSTFAGHFDGSADVRDSVVGADLRVFEPDGYRSWIYSQYFSVALAFDDLDERAAKGRVFLALPDSGKSMLVGRFEATRCSP